MSWNFLVIQFCVLHLHLHPITGIWLGNFILLRQLPLYRLLKADQELLDGWLLAVVAEESKGQEGSLNGNKRKHIAQSRENVPFWELCQRAWPAGICQQSAKGENSVLGWGGTRSTATPWPKYWWLSERMMLGELTCVSAKSPQRLLCSWPSTPGIENGCMPRRLLRSRNLFTWIAEKRIW